MSGQLATRVMRARHPGICPRCYRHINVGHQIAKLGGIWLCIRCAIDQQDEHHNAPKETTP